MRASRGEMGGDITWERDMGDNESLDSKEMWKEKKPKNGEKTTEKWKHKVKESDATHT